MRTAVREGAVARARGPLSAVAGAHHGYLLRDAEPARHLALPSPWITVVFTLDERLTMAQHVDPSQAPGDYDTLVGGLHTRPGVITHPGAQSGVMLQVSPLGSRALFGVPAGELASLDLDLADVLGRRILDVHEQVRSAGGWAERFAVLDRHLGGDLREDGPPPEVVRAWRHLLASGGTASVRTLARDVGWSERHLSTRFRTEIGLTPKTAARVIRFDRAKHLVAAFAATGGDVAARCGYADQSHLVRDFIAFTGLSPTGWLAAEGLAPRPE